VKSLPVRRTARLILLDPAARLLLIRYQAAPDAELLHGLDGAFWYTPGGGLDGDETYEQAARRELFEETGIANAEIGPCVATRDGPVLQFRRKSFTHARFYLVRAASDWLDTSQLAATEGDPVLDVRWWPLDAFERSGEMLLPDGLLPVVRQIIHAGAPDVPIGLA
jgi:8-oxo-dGTP pyrophosphatase MutT (NUDIX family)